MCKFASLFFIHQLHLMLLFNVSVTYIAAATAGDHSPVQNSSNPNQKRSDAFSTAPSTSSISAQAAGSLASDSRNLAGHLEPHLEPHLRFNSNLDTAASNYETNSPRNLDARLVSKLAAILDASNLVVVNDSQTNFSNEHSSVSADMRTNLDHLNELNNNNRPIYTDQYVVQLRGGPELARELTERHGFVYLGQVGHFFLGFIWLSFAYFAHNLLNSPNLYYLFGMFSLSLWLVSCWVAVKWTVRLLIRLPALFFFVDLQSDSGKVRLHHLLGTLKFSELLQVIYLINSLSFWSMSISKCISSL